MVGYSCEEVTKKEMLTINDNLEQGAYDASALHVCRTQMHFAFKHCEENNPFNYPLLVWLGIFRSYSETG